MKRLVAIAIISLAACADPDHTALRTAVDQSVYTLGETVERAEASVQQSTGVDARLHAGPSPSYAVTAVAIGAVHDVRLDLAGTVTSTNAAGSASPGCQTSITLSEALAIAAAAAGGDAVAVVPDDDDPCLREIQVLVDATLWEVKVGPDGAIIEQELSDEEL